MRIAQSYVCLCLLLLLASCSLPKKLWSPAQAVATSPTEQQRAEEEMRAMVAKAVQAQAGPALDPIRDKVYLGPDVRQTSLALMALQTKPTEPEKKALEVWHELFMGVLGPDMDRWLRAYMPWGTPVWELQKAASSSLLAELYGGSITYGEFNRRRLQIAANALNAMQERTEEIRKDARQQVYAQQVLDTQRSIAGSAALQNYYGFLNQQRLINQQFMPARVTPFTCTRLGNTMNCY